MRYHIISITPPWLVPSQDEEGGDLGPSPPSNKILHATVTTAKDLTPPGCRGEANHANGFMTAGDKSREDLSSSIADLLMPNDGREMDSGM